MYLVIEGMPGTGKTTLAKALTKRLDAVYMKSIFSNTETGTNIRKIINAGLHKEAEPFYVIDLVLDELRLQKHLELGNVVRDKTYASSLAHVHIHKFQSEECVSKALYGAYLELRALTIEPDYIIYVNPIIEKVKEHIYKKNDLSVIDIELISDLPVYQRQAEELESDLRDRYGDKVIHIDSYSGTVEEMTEWIIREIEWEENKG